jgi:5-methyltetrahydropteroyltriglutamate--homocysteine methyltransferase
MMFETSMAGSLPKRAWFAETNKRCLAWKLYGDELAAAGA